MKKRTVFAMLLAAAIISGLTGCGIQQTDASVPTITIESTSGSEIAVTDTITIRVTEDKGWDKDFTSTTVHITYHIPKNKNSKR